MTSTIRKRAERLRRKDAGEVRIEAWIDADVRNRLVAGCHRSGVSVARGIEMMVNDTWPDKTYSLEEATVIHRQAEVRRRVLNGDKPMRHATNGRSFKLQDKVALPGVCTGVVVSLKHDTIWVLWDDGNSPPEGFRAEELELLK